ncbi:MAG: hypothetical protein QNK05_11865 [Myxococcota bacterium]|nr:hypothetical protein [Myxococcota bacterium]
MRRLLANLACALPFGIGAFGIVACGIVACGGETDPAGPRVEVGILGVFSDPPGLLAVASDARGSVVARFRAGAVPIVPRTARIALRPWGGGPPVPLVIWDRGQGSATGVFRSEDLGPGLWTAYARVEDERGRVGTGRRTFIIEARRGPPPIGAGQGFWLDFGVEGDTPGSRVFAEDLRAFGLGSREAPQVSARVELRVIGAVLRGVRRAYTRPRGAPTGWTERIEIYFSDQPEFQGDRTRVCIGGAHPGGLGAVGSVMLDPNNQDREEELCGTTGVFPRGLAAYANEPAFRRTFDALLPERGGTPIGEHPLDETILTRGFEPRDAGPVAQVRWLQVERAIARFSQALASVIAHEVGHSLGLVSPGIPPAGLGGGLEGEGFSHASDALLNLMSPGSRLRFADLAGIEGGGPPGFRALDWAYLQDQVIVDSAPRARAPAPAFLRPYR